jgi:hypothetical protein
LKFGPKRAVTKKLNPKEMVTSEELLMSNIVEQGALVNLLEKMRIISKAALLEEIRRLRNKRSGG